MAGGRASGLGLLSPLTERAATGRSFSESKPTSFISTTRVHALAKFTLSGALSRFSASPQHPRQSRHSVTRRGRNSIRLPTHLGPCAQVCRACGRLFFPISWRRLHGLKLCHLLPAHNQTRHGQHSSRTVWPQTSHVDLCPPTRPSIPDVTTAWKESALHQMPTGLLRPDEVPRAWARGPFSGATHRSPWDTAFSLRLSQAPVPFCWLLSPDSLPPPGRGGRKASRL